MQIDSFALVIIMFEIVVSLLYLIQIYYALKLFHS